MQQALYWKAFLSSIDYDNDSQKIVFGLSPTTTWNDFAEPVFNIVRRVPTRIKWVLTSAHTGRQASMAAAIFGGTTTSTGGLITGWSADWDTGPTQFFESARQRYLTTTEDDYYQISSFGFLNIPAPRPSRMFIDPYVYVRGTPEQSIWSATGSQENVVAVQPRNRPPGYITSEAAYLGAQTHSTKTTLASLRSMMFFFTDSEGNTLQVDEDYTMKVNIEFQR